MVRLFGVVVGVVVGGHVDMVGAGVGGQGVGGIPGGLCCGYRRGLGSRC